MEEKKRIAYELINKKLNGNSFMTYKEIALITSYHPKYLLKLKSEILNNTISLEHGNKLRKPINTLSEEEQNFIVSLYKRSHVSIRKFVKFYGKRSYSCIYSVLKNNNLL
ncbi:MAG: hypothetical protein RRY16_02245 [Bacilli bacterium]